MFGSKNNKRLFPRVGIKGSLRYQVRGTQEYNTTMCEDISEDGVGFMNDRFIAPHTSINLEINSLPRLLQPKGKVVWAAPCPRSDRYRIGVKFMEMESIDKNFLTDYVNMKLNQQ